MASTTESREKAPQHWKKITAPWHGAETARSVLQLTVTLLGFALSWLVMLWSIEISYFLALALALPTACFLVRLFIIQHDCGHGSYFRSKFARDAVGYCLGVLTLTPFKYWAQTHNYHHSHSGDLDFRGVGDIDTMTVSEYRALSPWRRKVYRVYRNPIVLLGIGPAFHFLVKHRYPWDIPRSWKQAWLSVWITNLALVAVVCVMGETIGYARFAMLQLPVSLLACAIGVWLFYVQHQFENTYWHRHKDWNYYDAALQGSSHLVLPRALQWLTASIGIHHVHHLNSQIPNYKLEDCMKANPDLQCAPKITLRETFRLLRLSLWDEDSQELITFGKFKTQNSK